MVYHIKLIMSFSILLFVSFCLCFNVNDAVLYVTVKLYIFCLIVDVDDDMTENIDTNFLYLECIVIIQNIQITWSLSGVFMELNENKMEEINDDIAKVDCKPF